MRTSRLPLHLFQTLFTISLILIGLTAAQGASAQSGRERSKVNFEEIARSTKPLKGLRIGIDAGMGGEAPLQGKTNLRKVDAYTRMAEAMVNLKVAQALGEELKNLGAEPVALFGPNAARPEQRLSKVAEMDLDAILSIHHSYSVHPADNLTAAYYAPADDDGVEAMARRVNESLSVGLGLPSTGAVAAPRLLANIGDTPIALLICSLLSNPDEFLHAMEDDYPVREAKVIAQGIVAWVRERGGVLDRSERPSKMITAPEWRKRVPKSPAVTKTTQTPKPTTDEPTNLVGISPAEGRPAQSVKPVQPMQPREVVLEEDWSQAFKELQTPAGSADAGKIALPSADAPNLAPIPTKTPNPSASPTPKPSPIVQPSPTPHPLSMDDLEPPTPLPSPDGSKADAAEPSAANQAVGDDGPTIVAFKSVFPRPVKAPIDQTWLFGEVYDEATGLKRGVSFAAPAGTPVTAIAEGTVVDAVYDQKPSTLLKYARSILVEHKQPIDGNKVYSMYGQLAEIKVAKGDEVEAGQTLGTTGAPYNLEANDRSTAFEFEIRVGGKSSEDARNPELFLQPFSRQTGLIVGQFVNSQRQPLPRQKVRGVDKGQEYYSYTLTYDPAMKSTQWQENFAIGDVPAGTHTLQFLNEDGSEAGALKKTVKVEPSKITYLRVVR